jgi:hypothetical protein
MLARYFNMAFVLILFLIAEVLVIDVVAVGRADSVASVDTPAASAPAPGKASLKRALPDDSPAHADDAKRPQPDRSREFSESMPPPIASTSRVSTGADERRRSERDDRDRGRDMPARPGMYCIGSAGHDCVALFACCLHCRTCRQAP